MLIITHVAIALLGLIQATYGFVFPGRAKMRMTYLFAAATIVSGTYLAWSLHTPVLQSCESGLAYLTLVIAATLGTKYRLARMQHGE